MILTLFILLVILTLPVQVRQASADTPALNTAAQLQAESPAGVQGTVMPVRLWINNPGGIVAGSFTLSYDPAIVTPVLQDSNNDGVQELKVEDGDFGGGYNFVSNLTTPGQIILSAAALTPADPVTTDAILCTVYFTLMTEGVSPLTLTDAILSNGNDSFPLSDPVSGTLQVAPPVTLTADYETYAPSTDTDPVEVVFNGQVVSTFLSNESKIDVQILDAQSQEAGNITGISIQAADGKFTGTWTIPAALATGTYRLQAVYNGYTYANLDSFSVGNVEECFIATAAYGSKFEPAVVMLRHFRDAYLLTNTPGRAFVGFYYRNSPPVAQFIAGHQTLKALFRAALAPFIAMVWLVFNPGYFYALSGLLILSWWVRKRRRVFFP